MKTPLLIVVLAIVGWVAFTHGSLISVYASAVLSELQGYVAALESTRSTQISAVEQSSTTAEIWDSSMAAMTTCGILGLLWLRRLVRAVVV